MKSSSSDTAVTPPKPWRHLKSCIFTFKRHHVQSLLYKPIWMNCTAISTPLICGCCSRNYSILSDQSEPGMCVCRPGDTRDYPSWWDNSPCSASQRRTSMCCKRRQGHLWLLMLFVTRELHLVVKSHMTSSKGFEDRSNSSCLIQHLQSFHSLDAHGMWGDKSNGIL